MKTALIIGAIASLFLVWNFKAIFGRKKSNKPSAMKATKLSHEIASKAMGEAIQSQTDLLLSEILSLNRAAHVLTRSGSVLDKLLKLDKVKACESLIRDYELSSAMVLVSRDKRGKRGEVEGFKGIEKIEGKKMVVDGKDKEKIVKINTKDREKSDDKEEDEHHHHHHHHDTNSEEVRIELYCRNVGRVPRVGRVVKMVESEADHEEKYIIELIK